jgi:hypothetical protein
MRETLLQGTGEATQRISTQGIYTRKLVISSTSNHLIEPLTRINSRSCSLSYESLFG